MLLRLCSCGKWIPERERKCPACKRADNSRRARLAKRNGLKTAYRRARLELDGGLCTFRFPGCDAIAETVHLAPECEGNHLLATLENTRSACRHCLGIADAPRARSA